MSHQEIERRPWYEDRRNVAKLLRQLFYAEELVPPRKLIDVVECPEKWMPEWEFFERHNWQVSYERYLEFFRDITVIGDGDGEGTLII